MHEFEDTADIKSLFFSAVVTGIASTTFQTAARAVAASGDQARIFTSGIYALRLNRFAQYVWCRSNESGQRRGVLSAH
jgi:hypothetical protein